MKWKIKQLEQLFHHLSKIRFELYFEVIFYQKFHSFIFSIDQSEWNNEKKK